MPVWDVRATGNHRTSNIQHRISNARHSTYPDCAGRNRVAAFGFWLVVTQGSSQPWAL